jgi:hypothetical protein
LPLACCQVELEPFRLKWKRLTDFLRSLTRHGSRGGLIDHKRAVTQSSECNKPAFGGPDQPIGVVEKLARCKTPSTGAWMGLVVLRQQVLAVDPGIDLRGGQAGMTEQFLNGAKIGTATKQVGGKRVAQGVWRRRVR